MTHVASREERFKNAAVAGVFGIAVLSASEVIGKNINQVAKLYLQKNSLRIHWKRSSNA